MRKEEQITLAPEADTVAGPADLDKLTIRSRMRDTLRDLSDERRHTASLEACQRLIAHDIFRRTSVIMLYMPLATEVDTTSIALRAFQLGLTVCVPKVNWQRKDMSPIEVNSFDDHVMEVDEHNVRTPRNGRPVVPAAIDLVVVPGIAFDTDGHRLGRGGGYYDRFLARLAPSARTVGIAFDEQIIPSVPVNDRDVSVDYVVTDRRLTRGRRDA